MLTALQNQHYKTGEPLTDKQIAHIMIALLMAGQHTSAATGSWAILRLGENQDLQRRLYEEQVEYYLDKETGQLRDLEYETLQTPLLNAFVKELLRVHPPLHSLMRKIISDCPVPATVGAPAAEPHADASFKKRNEGVEYVVPKGEYVLAAPGYSQIDEKIWGADAKKFRVERWLEEGDKVPGDEDEGEEDYGWGKISKGGKSACAFRTLLILLDMALLPLILTTAYPPLLCRPSFRRGTASVSARLQSLVPFSTFADTRDDFCLAAASASSSPMSSSASSLPPSSVRTRGPWTSRSLATTTRCVLIPNTVALASLNLARACTDDDCHAGQAQKGHLHQACRCQGLICATPIFTLFLTCALTDSYSITIYPTLVSALGPIDLTGFAMRRATRALRLQTRNGVVR